MLTEKAAEDHSTGDTDTDLTALYPETGDRRSLIDSSALPAEPLVELSVDEQLVISQMMYESNRQERQNLLQRLEDLQRARESATETDPGADPAAADAEASILEALLQDAVRVAPVLGQKCDWLTDENSRPV